MPSLLDFCQDMPELVVEAGETLLTEGARDGRIYVLVDGEIAVMKGEVQVARVRGAGALFGEMATLLDRPTSATVVASSRSRLRVIEDAERFLSASPEVALMVARLLAQRLHDATSYLADIKLQFEDRREHFGMVDRILGSLVNQQQASVAAVPAAGTDGRL